MLRTYKYRIFPTKKQKTKLNKTLVLCCDLYNAALQERIQAYNLSNKSISYIDQQNQIPEIRKSNSEYKEVFAQVLQNVLRRVDLAYQGFFTRLKKGQKPGFPRFRSQKRYDSLTYTQNGFYIEENRLHLSPIGSLKISLSREPKGTIKTCTIKKSPTGKWYASLVVDIPKNLLSKTGKEIGIDLGVKTFATLSNGDVIENPKFLKKHEKRLKRAQRKKNYKHLRKMHEKITNLRKDFLHKQSKNLINNYDMISLEKLNISSMLQNNWRSLNKSINDTSWNQFVQMLSYKAEEADRTIVLVDPRGTSQECSKCGQVVKKDLSVRVHYCPCGLKIDRDLNAAKNILARGQASLGLMALNAF